MTRAVPRARRLLTVLLALTSLAAGVPAAAVADGDPASDILISQDVFYPYAPNTVAKNLQTALDGQLKAAKAAGFELKIALIAATADLGSVPQLLTDPQKYADLLTSELSFNTKPRVLVVLPSGLGGNNLGDGAGPALSGVQLDPEAGADGLARAAMEAVGALTAANGTPVAVPQVAAESGRSAGAHSGGGTSPLLVFGLPVALVALVAGVAALRGRKPGDLDLPAEDEELPAVDEDLSAEDAARAE
ncbi:MAG: hypothetical protein JWO02_3405 [Solirubrobacterales bacterium]|nr:hypothetical protein [Solirubrobacterales bacterium]